ncbi:MAG: ribosomal protein S19 family protein, partial [Patescibacteria group bacterium]
MARSSKKGPYIDPRVLVKVNRQKAGGDRTPIKTWSRACQISPDF